MNVTHFVLAVLIAAVVSSFTDWFFFGVLFHSRYQAYPEVWRTRFSGNEEWKAIVMATGISIFMAGMYLLLVYKLRLHGFSQSLELALAMWVTIAMPMSVTNFIFMKLDPRVLISHTLGWLVRLIVFSASFAIVGNR